MPRPSPLSAPVRLDLDPWQALAPLRQRFADPSGACMPGVSDSLLGPSGPSPAPHPEIVPLNSGEALEAILDDLDQLLRKCKACSLSSPQTDQLLAAMRSAVQHIADARSQASS
jgi:hypothetical protein